MPCACAFAVALLSGCTLPVAQPLLFGHGSVDPVPVPTGRVPTALTTDLIQVDLRPKQYAEHFGIISSENVSLAFDAFLIVRVSPGRSPELIQRFGPNWYASTVKEAFRTFIREEVQRYSLFQLSTDPGTREKLQTAVAEKVQTQVIKQQRLPIELLRVVMGSIMPPQVVLDQTVQTIVQQQRRLTMQEFEKAEEARAKAEGQRGLADLAYREHLGLSGTDYIDLRRVEVQKDLVEHSPRQFNIIMDLEHTGIHIPPISAPPP